LLVLSSLLDFYETLFFSILDFEINAGEQTALAICHGLFVRL